MGKLFEETNLGKLTLRNRTVMAPMVCFKYKKEDGSVTDENVEHYKARARGGIGMVIVEAACVNVNGRLNRRQLGIWSDSQIEGLKKISDVCHEAGSRVLIQIHHAGFKTPANVTGDRVSASDYKDSQFSSRALTIDEIKDIQQDFINGAKRARQAGYDGIELHGAHGYLISQFFSPVSNKREDRYGGSIENRARFTSEIVEEIRKELGKDFVICVRMGGNEPTVQESAEMAQVLERAGADVLHISWGISEEKGYKPVKKQNYKNNVHSAIEIRKAVHIPVIAVNGINSYEMAAELIDNDLVDFIAVGRGLLIDADWANKLEKGEAVKPCLDCAKCHWFNPDKACPQLL